MQTNFVSVTKFEYRLSVLNLSNEVPVGIQLHVFSLITEINPFTADPVKALHAHVECMHANKFAHTTEEG